MTLPNENSSGTLHHRIPWNKVFWLLVLIFGLGTLFFSWGTYLKRSHLIVEKSATINAGDAVRVVLVLNGDEILVEKEGARARVRMLGIRSFDPVVNEREITAFGHASVRFLEQWLLNKTVNLFFDAPIKDIRGRYLSYLSLDGLDINQMMLENGISMVYTEYPIKREQHYLTAERLARQTRVGIWGGKKATLRIQALRHEWAAARQERTGVLPPDYLLGENK